MMKKKFVAALLSAGMVVSALSGCGSGGSDAGTDSASDTDVAVEEESSEDTAETTAETEEADSSEDLSGTLTILSWYNETNSQPLLDGFKEKYPNITVELQYSPPVQDYVEKLSTMLYSGAGPDIFCMALENREDLIKGNYCEDLSNESYMTDGTIPDTVKETYGADGKAYALAVDCWAGGIFYNIDLFEQAGITEFPTTWDGLLEACQKLQDAGIIPIMDNMQDAAANFTAPLYGSEVKAENPSVVEEIYAGEKTFEETWTEPVTMWHQLIDEGYLDPNYLGSTSDDIVTAFATGQTAMMITGSWNVNTINSINPDLNYKCMPVPGTEDAYYCGAVNVGWCINSASENKDLARAFLNYCASPEGLEAQYTGYGGFTIAEGYTPDLPEEISDAVQGVRDGKYYIPMADWQQYTESLRLTYIQSLQDCMAGSIEPSEVGKRMDEKLAEVSQE